MSPAQIVVVQFVTNLTSCTVLMLRFVWPRLRRRPIEAALSALVAFHFVRTLGMFAAVPDFTGALARSRWAHHVAVGDFVTVLLALATVGMLGRRREAGIRLAWLMNVWGALDVVNAGVNAARERILTEGVGVQALVVTFGVPALIVTHVAMFVMLARARTWHPEG